MKKIFIPIIISAIALLLIFSYESGRENEYGKKMKIVFCDVGQGDAIYIRTPGDVDILIDGGRGNRVMDCLASHMPIWDRTIELVFATHPDADHIGGLVAVLKSYEVKAYGTVAFERDTRVYQELKELISSKQIPYKELYNGDNFTLSDGVKIMTLWPQKDFSTTDGNDFSLVQILSYEDFDLLLTGDISYQILNTLPVDGVEYDIFKLPHHGSRTGINDTTMAKIAAKLAIISAGRDNSYGHPHALVLSLLDRYKMAYLRTDERGHIEIVTDGQVTRVIQD